MSFLVPFLCLPTHQEVTIILKLACILSLLFAPLVLPQIYLVMNVLFDFLVLEICKDGSLLYTVFYNLLSSSKNLFQKSTTLLQITAGHSFSLLHRITLCKYLHNLWAIILSTDIWDFLSNTSYPSLYSLTFKVE